MHKKHLNAFSELWIVDAEYEISKNYELQGIERILFFELRTEDSIVLEKSDLQKKPNCPVEIGSNIMFIGFSVKEVWRCFLELGWKLPEFIIDLKYERLLKIRLDGCYESDQSDEYVSSLECALTTNEIEDGSTLPSETIASEGNVRRIADLFKHLCQWSGIEKAPSRGRFSIAEACMEHRGIPLDEELGTRMEDDCFLRTPLPLVACPVGSPIEISDRHDGNTHSNQSLEFETESDQQSQNDSLRCEFLLAWNRLKVGTDQRARSLVRPFGTITGRDRPKAGEFLFLQSKWFRSVIKPKMGKALVYIDWTAFEIGVAAGLSRDLNLMNHYSKSDIYTEFGKQMGLVESSTIKAPDTIRRILKECVLGCNYGMGVETLAKRTQCDFYTAQSLIDGHRKVYRQFWEFNEDFRWRAQETGLAEIGDWAIRVDESIRQTQLINWPVQSMAAHILRETCVRLVKAGIRILSSLHDSILIEIDLTVLKEQLDLANGIMRNTEAELLNGFKLRSEHLVISYPERYSGTGQESINKFNTVYKMLMSLKS